MRSMHVRTATGTYLLRRSRSNACDTLLAHANDLVDPTPNESSSGSNGASEATPSFIPTDPRVPRQRNRAGADRHALIGLPGRIVRMAKRLRHAWHRARATRGGGNSSLQEPVV